MGRSRITLQCLATFLVITLAVASKKQEMLDRCPGLAEFCVDPTINGESFTCGAMTAGKGMWCDRLVHADDRCQPVGDFCEDAENPTGGFVPCCTGICEGIGWGCGRMG